MNLKKLKEEYIGKKLMTIITLDTKEEYIKAALRSITKYDYGNGIDNAQLLLFEDNKALVFVDFDSDGYRSGDWYLIHLEEVLDKGQTKEIKTINSIVRNIEYFEGKKGLPEDYSTDAECVLITTDEYVILLGQDNVSDYYPRNFFDVKECKQFALKSFGKGEVIEFEEDKQ